MASIFGDEDGVDDILNENVSDENIFHGEENEEGNNGNEDAAENPVKVEPKKRSVRNPRTKLSLDTLRGKRGIHTIEQYFKDIKFKGKGHERNDLDEVMQRLQHWGHRMYPTYKFEDVLTNIERLSKKKELQVHMSRYRMGLIQDLHVNDGDVVNEDDDDAANGEVQDEPFDEFDALLGEQIAISKLAPRTPAQKNRGGGSGTANMSIASSSMATPSFNRGNVVMSTPYTGVNNLNDSDLAQPLPPSQPSTPAPNVLTSEQMARIAENRRIAQERLAAKRKQQQEQQQMAEVLKN